MNVEKNSNGTKRKKSNDTSISITEDRQVMEALGQISKSTKNKNMKKAVNNIIEEKKTRTKNNLTNANNYDNNNDNDNEDEEYNEEEYEESNTNERKSNYKKSNFKSTNSNGKPEIKTFTQNLTKEDIAKKLEDYKKVDDISTVPLNTHLRYFSKGPNGELNFRMGGNLKRNLDLPNFIVLRNALGVEWTVQVKNTIFYKKMEITDIKREYENVIETLHNKIRELKKQIADMEKDSKKNKKDK